MFYFVNSHINRQTCTHSKKKYTCWWLILWSKRKKTKQAGAINTTYDSSNPVNSPICHTSCTVESTTTTWGVPENNRFGEDLNGYTNEWIETPLNNAAITQPDDTGFH